MQLSALAAVPAAGTYLGPVVRLDPAISYLVVEAQLVYGSGGTTIDVYVQTSVDGGASWIDVMNFHMTTASFAKASAVVATTALAAGAAVTDGSLASGTILSGLIGDRVRTKTVIVGTYAASTLRVDGIAKAA
jgi:hypothetical protein